MRDSRHFRASRTSQLIYSSVTLPTSPLSYFVLLGQTTSLSFKLFTDGDVHGHTLSSVSHSAKKSSTFFSFQPSRWAASTSRMARDRVSFTYAFWRAVSSSSCVGFSSLPASHSRSFYFSERPSIYIHKLFNAALLMTLFYLFSDCKYT